MHFHQTPCVVAGYLDIVRPLAMAQLPIILATSVANRPAFKSRFCIATHLTPSSTSHPEEFITKLVEIGERYKSQKPILFFGGDTDLIAISNHRDELSHYFRFNMANKELVNQLTDKTEFINLAHKLSLPIPQTEIYNPGQTDALISPEIKLPCIIKPATRSDWFASDVVRKIGKPQKAIRIENESELTGLLPFLNTSAESYVVQELIPGEEKNIVSYHSYVSRDGRILGEFTGKKIRTFPMDYGLSSSVVIDDNEELKAIGRKIVKKTGIRGVSKMDFKIHEETGELKLLEINPRFSLWNHPGAKAGVNLELLMYRDIVSGADINYQHVKRSVKWVDFTLDASAYMEARSRGDLTFWSWIRSLRGPKVYPLWALTDPLPFLRYAPKTTLKTLGKLMFPRA